MKLVGWIATFLGLTAAASFVIMIALRSDLPSIAEAGLQGVALTVFGVGVLKRKKAAWFLGMGLIVVSLVAFWIEVTPSVLQESEGSRWWLLAVTWIGGALVAVFWGYLLYTHRRYFSEPWSRKG